MASLESRWICETTQEDGNERSEKYLEQNKNRTKKKSYLRGIGCFRSETASPSADKPERYRSLEMESDSIVESGVPTHLVVLVNGIMGSTIADLSTQKVGFYIGTLCLKRTWFRDANWMRIIMSVLNLRDNRMKNFFLSSLFTFSVACNHPCSECNSSMLTFDGIDLMGERLAEEVISVIKRSPEVQKISFVGHSLGGLIARYAIGRLYGQDFRGEHSQGNGNFEIDGSGNSCMEEKSKGKITGLEPMNFITSATPHLGSKGHKQVPMLGGFNIVEKVVSCSSWILGRTGKHLFLTDNDNGNPPLLLQMANDSGDLQFISALQSFRHYVRTVRPELQVSRQYLALLESVRGSDYPSILTCIFLLILYPLASKEDLTLLKDLVGWRTSSIRRENELPKHQHLLKNNKYLHIVNVEAPKTASPQREVLLEAKFNGCMTIDMEEAMIKGLTKVNWERVDVNFSRSKQRYFAHSTIQASFYFS
ncbi:hypothetical protein HHK36_002804 [Tetracentron sinense]|uniref:DUF676 domain-containing protein n=1 Tax=Tetracentron sinense TaxID=13715 RepID=A0A834ZM59_TETSI|nr:hypothetical protein HHK36_002804 [Tetracentron sinense]